MQASSSEGQAPHIPPIAIDIKVYSLSQIDVLEAAFQATLQIHVIWQLPQELWHVLADATTGDEIRAELYAIGEWPTCDRVEPTSTLLQDGFDSLMLHNRRVPLAMSDSVFAASRASEPES